MTSCTAAGGKAVAYDAVGNITNKSDVGTYSYPAAGQPRPHAVASITGLANGVVNPFFGYDANGNMTSGAGRTVGYTSYNMTASISQGAASTRFTYDAWGKCRVGSNWADDAACLQVSLTNRGYTGHEHIDAQCLINMNARLYDPTLGRFLSADSIGCL